jgi:hypothetical protein
MLPILEVPGLNIGQETDYPESGFSCFHHFLQENGGILPPIRSRLFLAYNSQIIHQVSHDSELYKANTCQRGFAYSHKIKGDKLIAERAKQILIKAYAVRHIRCGNVHAKARSGLLSCSPEHSASIATPVIPSRQRLCPY